LKCFLHKYSCVFFLVFYKDGPTYVAYYNIFFTKSKVFFEKLCLFLSILAFFSLNRLQIFFRYAIIKGAKVINRWFYASFIEKHASVRAPRKR